MVLRGMTSRRSRNGSDRRVDCHDGGHGERLQAEVRAAERSGLGVGVEGWRIRGRGAYLAAIRHAKPLQPETNNQNRRQTAACRSVSPGRKPRGTPRDSDDVLGGRINATDFFWGEGWSALSCQAAPEVHGWATTSPRLRTNRALASARLEWIRRDSQAGGGWGLGTGGGMLLKSSEKDEVVDGNSGH
jgi:hypothetical protein